MIKVPHQDLEPATLRALVEEFITRQGTDYGDREVSLESKVGQVMAQLAQNTAFITFDPESDTATIVSADDWKDAHRLEGVEK